jgi:hypothetical protein
VQRACRLIRVKLHQQQVRKAGVDLAALRSLIESAFGGRLIDDYLDKVCCVCDCVRTSRVCLCVC